VIYADHDEYTTFYANTRSNLNRVVEALVAQGCGVQATALGLRYGQLSLDAESNPFWDTMDATKNIGYPARECGRSRMIQ
jgi:hypothetical protein